MQLQFEGNTKTFSKSTKINYSFNFKNRINLKDPSTLSLIGSNLVVIVLALIQKWDTFTVLWIYWFQSVVIGFFNVFRILALKRFSVEENKVNRKPVVATQGVKIFYALFFAFHYGFFHYVYATFLILGPITNLTPTAIRDIFIGAAVFFVNHFFSFMQNVKEDSQQKPNIGGIMVTPYARIVPMHMVIVLALALGSATLPFFLLLKTFMDVLSHSVKHKNQPDGSVITN